MLSDTARLAAYEAAITAAIRAAGSGAVVVDVGAGTGVLSLIAARAGAARVIAVEANQMAAVASAVAEANGFGSIISVEHGTVEEVISRRPDLHGAADVVVSEWMGFYLYHEAMLPAVLAARDAFLKPGGALLPCAASLWAAPASFDSLLAAKVTPWGGALRPLGFDFTAVAPVARAALCRGPQVLELPAAELLGPPRRVSLVELRSVDPADLAAIGPVELAWPAVRAGVARGVGLWFDVLFPCGTVLSTAPAAAATHWRQTAVLLPRDVPVERGAILRGRVGLALRGRDYVISLELRDPDTSPAFLVAEL